MRLETEFQDPEQLEVEYSLKDSTLNQLSNIGLIDEQRRRIDYQPDSRRTWYRQFRSHVSRNVGKYALGGAAVVGGVGGVALMFPETRILIGVSSLAAAGGVAAVGALGRMIKPLDMLLYANPKDTAIGLFKNLPAPWYQTYGSINTETRKELENLVFAARNADVLREEFRDYDDQVKTGIMIARTADILSDVGLNGRKGTINVKGLKPQNVIDMMRNQKLDDDEDTRTMAFLNKEGYGSEFLVDLIRKIKTGAPYVSGPQLFSATEVIEKYLDDFEFRLTITGAKTINSAASQLSKGQVRVRTKVGDNCGSYMGAHSQGNDFPRIFVNDDAGPSFMTRASRGFGHVGGHLEQSGKSESTGGILFVDGVAEHKFCEGMDDSTWPSIGVAYGGIAQPPKNGVKNGLVVALNEHNDFSRKSPRAWLYSDGKREEFIFRHREDAEKDAGKVVHDYIDNWVNEHSGLSRS